MSRDGEERRMWRRAVVGVMAAAAALAPSALPAQAQAERAEAATRIAARTAEGRLDQALAAYDAYVEASRAPDAELLVPIARAELRLAGAQADASLSRAALERLAAAGDSAAAARIEEPAKAKEPPASLASLAELARQGRKDARERLERGLDSQDIQDRLQTIQAIRQAGVRELAPRVAGLLTDPHPGIRTAAAAAMGDLKHRDAISRLREMFERDAPIVKASAAAALAALGDTTGEDHLNALLKSEIPDVRLKAAAALHQAGRTHWITPVKELRNDRDELARVRAAELLACCDVPTARAILIEALNSPMPPLRAEAARVLETSALADARLARRMLGDAFAPVRVHGAGAALELAARASKRSPR